MATYNVLDVCAYVINYSNEKDYGVSNLKLQKLLYFIQAYFLVSDKFEPCFDERIEAWSFGPVVPDAYHEYKRFVGMDIPDVTGYYDPEEINMWDAKKIPYNPNVFKEKDKEKIKEIVDTFSDYSATDLVTITHGQDPWINAYKPYANKEITKEAIKEFFDGKIQ